jgi:catechol-2,3-dioxygenase
MLSGMAIPIQVVFDCADPAVVAQFWAEALGYELQGPPRPSAAWLAWQDEQGVPEEHRNDASAIIDPDGNGPRIYFQRVPEPKTVKNRLHLDVISDTFDTETERLVSLGAQRIRDVQRDKFRWTTFADIEGNEFDLIAG